MRKCILPFCLVIALCASAAGQQADILPMLSPKLREFVTQRPKALQTLTNSLYGAFSNRTIQLYYFYSDDESIARASHYYPDEGVVGILIRENQLPLDEFICLVFEGINSTGEQHFRKIIARAQSGDLSKTDFVQEMRQTEFIAIKRTRDVLKDIKVDKDDAAKSYYYKRFVECPDGFDDFVVYSKKVSSAHRNKSEELEQKYDELRKSWKQ